jgi:hypothetical protein
LPHLAKLRGLQVELERWSERKAYRKRELLSLIGRVEGGSSQQVIYAVHDQSVNKSAITGTLDTAQCWLFTLTWHGGHWWWLF